MPIWYGLFCDDCSEWAEVGHWISDETIEKIFLHHDLFLSFMKKHGGHSVSVFGDASDEFLTREYDWKYSQFTTEDEEKATT